MKTDELWSSRNYLTNDMGVDEKIASAVGRILSQEEAQELCALSPDEMAVRLSNCLVEIEKSKREVLENEAYLKAKQDVKYFDDALKDKVNPLKATVSLLVHLLDS